MPGSPFQDDSREQSHCKLLADEALQIRQIIQTIEKNIENQKKEIVRSENSIQLLRQSMTEENRQELEQEIQYIKQQLDVFKKLISSQKRELEKNRNSLGNMRREYNYLRCQRFTPLRF